MEKHFLLDGVLQNAKHPSTFGIPTDTEKQVLKVSDIVKLGFIPKSGSNPKEELSERMWVIITELTEYGYSGTINNDPVSMSLSDKQPVNFEAKHILAIYRE